MSLFTKLQSASTRAQSVLAQMQGAEAGGANTLLDGGATVLLVYGAAQVIDEPQVGGGYKRRTVLTATGTRAQFSAAPVPKKKLTRTDITPQITYLVDVVDLNDPLIYSLILEKVGA